jgi:hypothetical protein
VTDPKRLADSGSDASEALRGLLRSSRDDLPGAARLEGLAARLGPLLGGAAVGGTGDPPAPDAPVGPEVPVPDPSLPAGAASGGGVAAKALGVGAAIVVLVGGAWLLTRPDPVTGGTPSVSPPVVQAPAASRNEQVAPAAAPNPPPLPTAAESAAPKGKAQGAETSRSPASGPSESALLAQAQAALSTNPQRALALTREHKRRYPSGALAQEREVIAIEALNRIGDGDAARKRAKEFETSYPGSAHRRKVQNATKP